MGNLFKNLQLIHYDQKTELTGDMTLVFLLKYFRNMSLFSIKHKALSCHHLVFSNIYNPFALWDGCMKISPWVLFEFSQFLFYFKNNFYLFFSHTRRLKLKSHSLHFSKFSLHLSSSSYFVLCFPSERIRLSRNINYYGITKYNKTRHKPSHPD